MSSSPFSNPSKMCSAADSGEAFGISRPAVHIRVDGAEHDGMDRHALAGQERS